MQTATTLPAADEVRIIPGLFGEPDFVETHAHRVQNARLMAEALEAEAAHELDSAKRLAERGNLGASDACMARFVAKTADADAYRAMHAQLAAMGVAADPVVLRAMRAA